MQLYCIVNQIHAALVSIQKHKKNVTNPKLTYILLACFSVAILICVFGSGITTLETLLYGYIDWEKGPPIKTLLEVLWILAMTLTQTMSTY